MDTFFKDLCSEMLLCSQLKLSERRSVRRVRNSSIGGGTMVLRPCTRRIVTEVPQEIPSFHQVTEKRMPELRIVSLNLEDHYHNNNGKKFTRTPNRIKILQKNNQRDIKDQDDGFLVRGYEIGSNSLSATNPVVAESLYSDDEDLKFLQNGIQIQLTDCCQCVCDLFNNDFQMSDDDLDLSLMNIASCNSLRPFRPKDVASAPINDTQANNILDPNILKVIRVTMNTKKRL